MLGSRAHLVEPGFVVEVSWASKQVDSIFASVEPKMRSLAELAWNLPMSLSRSCISRMQ